MSPGREKCQTLKEQTHKTGRRTLQERNNNEEDTLSCKKYHSQNQDGQILNIFQ